MTVRVVHIEKKYVFHNNWLEKAIIPD